MLVLDQKLTRGTSATVKVFGRRPMKVALRTPGRRPPTFTISEWTISIRPPCLRWPTGPSAQSAESVLPLSAIQTNLIAFDDR
jgi:hypothetical protein